MNPIVDTMWLLSIGEDGVALCEGGGRGGIGSVGRWIRRCGVRGIERLRHRNSRKFHGPLCLTGYWGRWLNVCYDRYSAWARLEYVSNWISSNCIDWRGLSKCNRYKEPVIIRWGSHVRMFLGGVGRDRIQLDRQTFDLWAWPINQMEMGLDSVRLSNES